MEDNPKLLTVSEVAKRWNTRPMIVYAFIDDHKLPCVKIRGSVRVFEKDFDVIEFETFARSMLLTLPQVMRILGVSKSTLLREIKDEKLIPDMKDGNLAYYLKPQEVERYLLRLVDEFASSRDETYSFIGGRKWISC